MTYRQRLESEMNEILSMLNGGRQHITPSERRRGASRLREIATEMQALDARESWTQPESETLSRIVLNDLRLSRRVTK